MTFSEKFRISMQRALWGEIRPTVRAIALGWKGEIGRARFVFDEEPDDDDLEILYNVESEVVSDFPDNARFSFTAEPYDENSLGFHEGETWWAYVRWEGSDPSVSS